MYRIKLFAWSAVLTLLFAVHGCMTPDPEPPDALPVVTVYGIYEGSVAAQAESGTEAEQSEGRAGAQVEAYALSDNGTQTPVAGGAQQLTTDEQGGFEIPIFETVKNLIIKITKDGDEEKCVLTNIGQEAASGQTRARFCRLPAQAANNAADNATEYALVNPETDVEADMILSEVTQNGTPPGQVNSQDIDEIIDPDIARDIRDDSTVRDCVIGLLNKGRANARALFIDILEDKALNQETVDNATLAVREAVETIEALRRETRKKIYELKTAADNDTQAQIEALLNQQRQQVLQIFKEAGIPPQLYMKASLISQSAFERSVFKIGPTCAAGELALGNKLIRRVLIRRVQEDAQQSINVLRDVFGYDNTTAINEARLEFEDTLMSLDPNLDAGPAHGSALRAFYRVVIGKILAAVDNRLVSDLAIMRVLDAMQSAMPQLTEDLQAAQDSEAIKAAYEDYEARFQDAVKLNIPILADEKQGGILRKKVLIDLLFSIGTH